MLDSGHEEQLAILAPHQLGKQLDVAKRIRLVVAHDHRDVVALAVRRLDIDDFEALVAERTLAIRDSRQRTKRHLLRLVALVVSCYLSKRQNSNISGQAKRLAHFVVVPLMQGITVRKLTLISFLSHPVARGIEAAHRLFERSHLLSRSKELDLYRSFHYGEYNHKKSPWD